MNDFGVKNMDQVAPVANSFRGTLKVSEWVFIKFSLPIGKLHR
jgi:hypothetical protein